MEKLKDVDTYIASAPTSVRGQLRTLRAILRKAVPKAIERISYGMPYYHHQGRLAYFRHWKAHIGLYIPKPVIANHRAELKDYETSDATVRFPLDQKLPAALIRKLVKAQMKLNEARNRR